MMIINESKKIQGITLPSYYLSFSTFIDAKGNMLATPVMYANRDAFLADEPISLTMNINVQVEEYGNDGQPNGNFYNVPQNVPLDQISISAGIVPANQTIPYDIVRDNVTDHLINIGFISSNDVITIDEGGE